MRAWRSEGAVSSGLVPSWGCKIYRSGVIWVGVRVPRCLVLSFAETLLSFVSAFPGQRGLASRHKPSTQGKLGIILSLDIETLVWITYHNIR
jgi:hypothetical protein